MPHYAAALGVAHLLNEDRRSETRGAIDRVESEAATIARARRHRADAAAESADGAFDEVEEVRGLPGVRRLFGVVAHRPGLRASSEPS